MLRPDDLLTLASIWFFEKILLEPFVCCPSLNFLQQVPTSCSGELRTGHVIPDVASSVPSRERKDHVPPDNTPNAAQDAAAGLCHEGALMT